jgi:acyl-coenzyme A synthetase/AMP-(fatty) acid ligase
MRMLPRKPETLSEALKQALPLEHNFLSDGLQRQSLRHLLNGAISLADGWAGRSVMIAVATQFEAARALVCLDGTANRLLLLPPDVKAEHYSAMVRDAAIDTIVCSDPTPFGGLGVEVVTLTDTLPRMAQGWTVQKEPTQWLMLTSGTTGEPKIAVHTFSALTGAIKPLTSAQRPSWATFYDIRRYGGLQIFLRAMLAGGSLALSSTDEVVIDHLERLAAEGVTHVSGTPTHWRRALMSNAASVFAPKVVRLSGEIADQAILDGLKAAFPQSAIGHAYASTEAGVGFEVTDGLEGFPVSYLETAPGGVHLSVVDGSLRIKSSRMASEYAGRPDLVLVDADGSVDTGDIVEIRDGRCYFVGRRGGIINVGGLKVHPEEVETVINRHSAVRQSRVRARKSPVIGSIVVADLVLTPEAVDIDIVKQEIFSLCKANLPLHKIPAVLSVVPLIEVTAGGKVARAYA